MTGRFRFNPLAPASRLCQVLSARVRGVRRALCGGLVLIAIFVSGRTASHAQDHEPSAQPNITAIRAGFDGRFKVGYWTPFEIVLEGGQSPVRGQVELTVLDGDGVPSRVSTPPAEPVSIDPGQQVTVLLYAKVGQLSSGVTVELTAEGQVLASRRAVAGDAELAGILPSSRELIVSLGSPLAAGDTALFNERRATVARVANPSRLPRDWWGYEGVDWVFVSTGDQESVAQLAAQDVRVAALDEWVRMGGKLLLSVGRHGSQVLAPESPLARLAPGKLETLVPLRQSTILEAYAGTNEPLAGQGGAFALEVPKLTGVRGKIEAYAGLHARDLPLVVRTPHDFGQIVFVGFDLERAPLANWTSRPQLFNKLLRQGKATETSGEGGALGQVTTLGFVDLAGQLRGALDQFAGVALVPFWLVALLIVAYIACIGPLDYFLVKKVLGRMEATWITFAVTAVAFSGGASALAYRLKGDEVRVNQLDVVDVSADTGLVRGTSWANLFSPDTTLYDLSLRPPAVGTQPAAPQVLLSWMGLPGTGFGGMDPETKFGGIEPGSTGVSLFTEPYSYSPALDRMIRVPVAVWSSKAFVGRWRQQCQCQIEAALSDRGKLVGTLTSHLDGPLEDSVLLYDRWAYPIRSFKPGERLDIETALDPQTVDTYLRHVTAQGDRNIAAPYDPRTFDVPRIIEIMSAFELAGGEKYTGLAHAYQGFVDLSGVIRDGRAVLIGRRTQSATALENDGQSLGQEAGQHWTVYRFVFPVSEPESP